jgi:hypothetical protein
MKMYDADEGEARGKKMENGGWRMNRPGGRGGNARSPGSISGPGYKRNANAVYRRSVIFFVAVNAPAFNR